MQVSMDVVEATNTKTVEALYDAFNARDVETVRRVLPTHMEAWFHGPPSHQLLLPLLSGSPPSPPSDLIFAPICVVAFGSTAVIAEGFDERRGVFWVHSWTFAQGIITQVREFVNTSVTVTRLAEAHAPPSGKTASFGCCQRVWESKMSDCATFPGLVVAL